MSSPPLARGFSKGSLEKNPLIGQWLQLDVPGVLQLQVGKVEFGQGIGTALVQIAAEELALDPARVRLAAVRTGLSPDEGVTSGSLSVQHSGDAVRLVCASLRALAVSAFCSQHGGQASSVRIEDGRLRSTEVHGVASYWTLGLQQQLAQGVSATATPKPAAQYTLVGTALPRRDLPPKLFGMPVFIQDIQLPGMLHGRVVRVPNRAARLVAVDTDAVRQRYADVTVVRDGSFLGVLAAQEEVAIAAAAVLAASATWDMPASLPDSAELNAFLRHAPAHANVVASQGDAPATPAAQKLEAVYARPYIAHASIGPSCALAHWRADDLQVWTHSQGIYNLQADIAIYLQRDHAQHGLPSVVVHHAEGAGCYGHNPADDVAFDAVLLSRFAQGRPVRVLWSRADELSCGPSGPAHVVALSAELDAAGRVVAWQHDGWANGYTCRPGRSDPGSLSFLGASQIENPFTAPMSAGGGSDRNAVPLYRFPQHKVITHRLLDMPIRTSAIRALGGHANVWAIESFMDELAHASGQDPLAFRLAHLDDQRARAVIERAVAAAPWWHARSNDAEGTGRGLAFARYKNTGAWCAVAVRVLAERAVRVLDISIAADLGLVINPDGAANQLEGGAIQSCSWTLHEALAFSRDRITTRSWADYPILSFSETPSVTVSLIPRPDQPPLGAGEASQGPTAAAIGNAVFDALGVRIRQLPITPERILSTVTSS
jgi:CO/xanthine dehydrogenase Mo-binding subunit